MSCQFNFDIPGDTVAAFAKVQSMMAKNNGTITGDQSAGSFTMPIPFLGKVIGTYAITNQTVTIAISQKPGLLSCNTIESAIKSKL